MANVKKKPLYQIINGIHFPAMFSPKCILEAFEYKPRSSDLLVVTYPKCGTTWMQNLVLHIYRKGVPLETPQQFLIASPFIDMLGNDGIEKMLHPGAIKTHLPYNHMPYSPEAKYIFVARNPFDTCVSLYYHTRMMPGFGYWDGEFDDFFELFMRGEVEYNDFFDHLLSWYPHRNDNNIFYTTYEAMKKDIKSVMHKVANFMGKEYAEIIEKDNSVSNNILHYTSFEYMKRNLADVYDSYSLRDKLLTDPNSPEGLKFIVQKTQSLNPPDKMPKMEFVRKGIVGDWKNHFSTEQEERLNKKLDEKTKGSDLHNLWSV